MSSVQKTTMKLKKNSKTSRHKTQEDLSYTLGVNTEGRFLPGLNNQNMFLNTTHLLE